MDHDKDGIISKSDLRATFDAVGKLASDKELDEMVNEASGPINFTQLLTLFANRMSGGGGKTYSQQSQSFTFHIYKAISLNSSYR